MRGVFLGSVMALAALPAMAGSIEELTAGKSTSNSIITIDCPACIDEAKVEANDYIVPELAVGTQKVEIRDTEDGKELIRIEAWQGGSPVRNVSLTQAALFEQAAEFATKEQEMRQAELDAKQSDQDLAPGDPGVDLDATTAALKPGDPIAAATAEGPASEKADPDTDKLELRLN